MTAVSFTKIPDFVEALAEGEFNLGANTIQMAMSNTAPGSETSDPTATGNGVLANVTQIAYTNYTDDLTVDRVMEGVTSVEAGGTYTFNFNDFIITASGGAIAQFRYLYFFDQTSATPDDQLIALFDFGSAIDLLDTQTLTFTVNASGFLTIA